MPIKNQQSSDIEPIVGIQFGIFSPEEIERRSVVEITNAGTFDGNEPRIGGLFDPRMGTLENGKTCRSCGQTNHNCPGHFGHYKLARPVYYIQFFPMILNILSCICIRCSKLLIDKDDNKNLLKKRGEARWKVVLNLCKNINRCGEDIEDGCGALQPSRWIRESIVRIVAEWDGVKNSADESVEKKRQVLECEYVYRLFRRISDEDVDFMGLSRYWCRPDWMICSVLAIPPPQVRPSVIQDNNQRSEDDLTHKLFEIIQSNNTLQDKINNNANKKIIDDQYAVLQYHIATLVDNQIPGVAPSAQRSGRPLKSIQQRLGTKEGRIRYNIQGKRVEFSGRSVITPDPNISIEEIGVPIKIAMNLTMPECVTQFNRSKMYKLIQNGADVYPGAKTIVRKDGRIISLKHVNTKEIVLHFGDTVNRHLMDGDPLLFNRQPTLHRMSMMGHRVKVLPYNTFRLNVSVTSPYNADFDGDEMNCHIPQSYEAAIELMEIAAVPKQIITPRHAKPVIGIVQDTLIGSYRLTQSNVSFNRREFMNMMMWNKHFDGRLPEAKNNRYTGQQVLSKILPSINMEMGNSRYDDEKIPDNFVKIREGQVSQGVFDKPIFSKEGKGIIHTIFKDYGPRETVHFLDCMQSTIEQFLIYNGFSVGISDLIADEQTKRGMDEKIRARKAEVENILTQIHLNLFTNNTGKSNKDEFENRVFSSLNKATEESGKIGRGSLSAENRLVSMVRAGSKGSDINIAQMLACVGQQAPENKRIPLGFTDRTLPHYKKYDDGAEARGFVESSFIRGLSPQEFFFHAMSGREGLIDTAVKSVTGDTPIIIIENGELKRVEIGPWIDAQLKIYSNDVEQYDETQANLELLNITNEVTIPTVDMDGKMSWGKISAITRHDPGEKIYEIKTHGGRDVIVSAGKSLLIWNNKTSKFEEKPTPEAKIGDYVPVTAKLPTPPVTKTKVELKNYLSKNQYIYGTDFIKAENMMNAAMETDRIQIPRGWWEEHNGKEFTLPYSSKARFQRTLVRSELSKIESGYLYPFHASREVSKTSEIFELNNENGIFLGLFLAEGNVDIKSGYIQITNNDINIREFTKNWFEKNGIKTSEAIKTNEVGTSSCIRGYSSIFAQFLDKFVGHGAEHKYVPSEAFISSEEFITGILNGYFSGDGTVGTNNISSTSSSKRLTNGISLLCNRLGIFGRIRKTQLKSNNFGTENILPSFVIDIRSKWAKLFAQKIPMIHNEKQIKLNNISTSFEHKNFPSQNDIVLDAITEINEMTPEKYPKLYDLTVPSTFNFMIENGHNCRDTADTGYIQRQLVKAMEDLVTQNDGTVRDAKMNIVQFHYGGDGLNSTMIEAQTLGIGALSKDQIVSEYGLEGVDLSDIFTTETVREDDAELLKNYVERVLKDQDTMVQNVNRYRDISNKRVYSPVNIERLMETIRVKFKLSKTNQTDLTPAYVLTNISRVIEKTQPYHRIWCALLRFYLAPHKVIGIDRFTKDAFDLLCELLIVKNYQARAQPGEQVGIIAAQSIGEPSTQMTLNTFHLAGVASKSNVTRGVPRLKELLKVTQNPKAISLTVPLKREFRESIDKARQVAQDLELTLLKDIVLKCKIYYDPFDETSVVEEDRKLLQFYKMFENKEETNEEISKWLLRLEFDKEIMFKKNISLDNVAFVLSNKFDENISLVYSDYNSDNLVMRIRLNGSDKDSSKDDILNLKKFENKILTSIVIRGIPSIKSVSYRKDTNYYELVNNKYEQITQYILDTDGSNFLEIVNHPYVNGNAVLSSHVHDIYENLGIEAARATLLNEITNLFAEAGGVDFRHLGLLCDWITRVGKLLSVDRYGINKQDIGPLSKASFEETERILLKAAIFGEVDPIVGVSANIMTGQPIRGGTSFSDILFDEQAFMRLQEGLAPVAEGEEDDDEYEATEEDIEKELYESAEDKCAVANLKLNVTLGAQTSIDLEEPDVEALIIDDKE